MVLTGLCGGLSSNVVEGTMYDNILWSSVVRFEINFQNLLLSVIFFKSLIIILIIFYFYFELFF